MTNKTAFITGAAKGIGRATAVALSTAGCRVILTDIDETALAETVENLRKEGANVSSYLLDVGQPDEINRVHEQALADHQTIEYFVNNAGISGQHAPLHLTPAEEWHKVINIDLTRVFQCLQAQVKILLPQGGGSIVNVASLAGKKGVVLGAPYAAAKHGVLGLTKTAALEYGQHGIRVNAVCPSFLETDIIQPVPDKVLDFVKNHRVPLKRLGLPEEAANTIAWLLSDQSSFVNGHGLTMDGGMSVG